MKKGLLCALVLFTAMSLFANGGGEAASSDGTVELSLFWRVGQYAIGDDNPIVQAIAEKTGVKLNYMSIPWNGYTDKLSLSVASGDMADIVMNEGPTHTNPYQWADQGIFMDLSEYLADAPNITSKVPASLFDQLAMPDGGTYFIPRLWSAPHVFIIRDDLLAKYDLEAPETMDEFLEVAEVLSQDYDGNGVDDTYAYGGFGFLFWVRWVSSAYELPRSKYKLIDGEYKYCDTVPESVEWVTFLKKMYDEGIMDPEILVLKASEGREKFYQGKFAMAGMRLDDVDRANDTFAKAGSDAHVTAFPPPKGANGKGGYWFGAPVDDTGIGYWMTASLPTTCSDPDAAVKVMDFMMSDEGTELGFWGREGQEFKRDPDVKYEWIADLEEREKLGLPLYVNFLTGEPIYGEAAGNPWAPEALSGIRAAQNSVYNDFLQIVPSNDKIVELTADLGTFCDEQITNFIVGNRPISEFNDYIDEWYARGGGELLEEINREMAAKGK